MSSSKDFHHGTKKSVRSFCEISSAETMGIIIHFWHLMEASIFQKSHLISDVLFFLPGNCRKLLDSGNITEHGGDMFCNSCYRKNFGPKGYGFGGLHMDDGKNYTVSFYFPPCAFSTFFSLVC